MSERRYIPLSEKLAAALLALGDVAYEDAKQMTARQITSLYHFDHNRLHALERDDPEVDAFWNLTPRLIKPHREKSKRDTAIVAKVKRIERKQRAHSLALMAGKRVDLLTVIASPPRKFKWPKRKLQSRGFPKRKSK